MNKISIALALFLASSTTHAQDVVAVNQDVSQQEQIRQLQEQLNALQRQPVMQQQVVVQQQVAPVPTVVLAPPKLVKVRDYNLLTETERNRLQFLNGSKLSLFGPIALTVASSFLSAVFLVAAVEACEPVEDDFGYETQADNCGTQQVAFASISIASAVIAAIGIKWIRRRASLRRERNLLIRKSTILVPSQQAVEARMVLAF